MSKYLGVDWGERKIGLALGSSETDLAVPHKVVRDIEYIKKLCEEEGVDVIVVGMARMENACRPARQGKWQMENRLIRFVERLRRIRGVKVELADERLTTKMAGKLDKNLKGEDDAVAAQLILQGWMDLRNRDGCY